jgi:hypothetical protein
MAVRAYVSRKMTGVLWNVLAIEAKRTRDRLSEWDIEALCPVLDEIKDIGFVPPGLCGDGLIGAGLLAEYWARDKAFIRRAHVLIDMTPSEKSEGSSQEHGYARWFLWMPVIRVYRGRPPFTAELEDDAVVSSLDEAISLIKTRWGTRRKRFLWRVGVYGKYWRRGFWQKLAKWFQ